MSWKSLNVEKKAEKKRCHFDFIFDFPTFVSEVENISNVSSRLNVKNKVWMCRIKSLSGRPSLVFITQHCCDVLSSVCSQTLHHIWGHVTDLGSVFTTVALLLQTVEVAESYKRPFLHNVALINGLYSMWLFVHSEITMNYTFISPFNNV